MDSAITETTAALRTLISLLKLSNRAPDLRRTMVDRLTQARGDPEPLKTLQRPNLGTIEVDIISDSSLILHPAASTPGASIKLDGKIGKPPGFKYTVEEIHKMIIQFATTNATVNIASQGGATTGDLYEVATELLSKSPVATGAGGRATTRSGGRFTRMCVVVWGCNDVPGGK